MKKYKQIILRKTAKLLEVELGNMSSDASQMKVARDTARDLIIMGSFLDNIDAVQEKNRAGFNRIDKFEVWPRYSGIDVSSLNNEQVLALIPKLQKILGKYKRQLVAKYGEDKFRSLVDFKVTANEVPSQSYVKFTTHPTIKDAIAIVLVGKRITAFRDFLNVIRGYGFRWEGDSQLNVIPAQLFPKINFTEMADKLDAIGVDVVAPSKDLIKVQAPIAPQTKSPAQTPVQPSPQPSQQSSISLKFAHSGYGEPEIIFRLYSPSFGGDDFHKFRGLMSVFGVQLRKVQLQGGKQAWENYFQGDTFPYTKFVNTAKGLGFAVGPLPNGVQDNSPTIVDAEEEAITKQIIEKKGTVHAMKKKDRTYILCHPYDQQIIEALHNESKEITKYNPNTRCRESKDIRGILEIISFIKQYRPDWQLDVEIIYQSLKEIQESKKEQRAPIEAIQKAIAPGYDLFGYQYEAVRFLDKTKGVAYIGDETGLGKTLEIIAWLVKENKRAVVVSPLAGKRNWLTQAIEFFPSVYQGKTAELNSDELLKSLRRGQEPDYSNMRMVSANYDSVQKFMPYILKAKFDTIILDEAHYLKNSKALRTQRITQLAQSMPHRILVSGTPIKNKKDELYSEFNILVPGYFKSQQEIKMMTFGDLKDKMSPYYISRLKEEETDLPPKTTQNVDLDINPADMPEAPTYYSIEMISRFRKEMADAKVPYTVEFINDLLEGTADSILVFTHSVDAAKKMYQMLGPQKSVLHHGGMTYQNREKIKKDYQDPANPQRVFITTGQSLNISATLTRANIVIFNDLPWTPADVQQQEDRTHRPGQKKPVTVYWVNAKNNEWDMKLNGILLKKYIVHTKVNRGKKLTPAEQKIMMTKIEGEDVIDKMKDGDVKSVSGEQTPEDEPQQIPKLSEIKTSNIKLSIRE